MTQEWGMESPSKYKEDNSIGKLFIHGSILQIVALTIYIPIFMITFISPTIYMLDLMFGIIVLGGIFTIMLLGFGNSILAQQLWNIKSKNSIGSYLGQGFLISVMGLLFFPVYLTLPLLFLPIGISTGYILLAPFFVVSSIINGYLGKYIAPEFESAYEGQEELASVRDRHEQCPNCGKHFNTKSARESISGYFICPHCQTEAVRSGSQPDIEF